MTAPTGDDAGSPGAVAAATDPLQLLRERSYVAILLLGAIVGVPVAAVAYGFLVVSEKGQEWVFTTLPVDLGFDATPVWWPVPFLALGGLLVALAIDRLPGTGGHSPADGFTARDGAEMLERRRGTLTAIATHAAALLGPQLVDLDDHEAVELRVSDVIDRRAFHPVFQPVFELATHRIVGYEALTRFDDDTRPDLMFAEAHRAGSASGSRQRASGPPSPSPRGGSTPRGSASTFRPISPSADRSPPSSAVLTLTSS